MSCRRVRRAFRLPVRVKLVLQNILSFNNSFIISYIQKSQISQSVNPKMAATSVVVLDRGNNTTCTVNLFGKYLIVFLN